MSTHILFRYITIVLLCFFYATFFPSNGWSQINGSVKPQGMALVPLIQAPRETLQQLKTAEQLIQEKQYTDGVRLLWNLMKESEDAFVSDSTETENEAETPQEETPELEANQFPAQLFNEKEKLEPISQKSLKSYIQQIIGSLPEEAREASELIMGTEAESALEKALESGSIEALAEVSRNYYHTQAGYKASFLLGTALLYDGQSYSAWLTFERLAQLPSVCAEFEPAFSVLRLNSLILSGQQESKKELVVSLRSKLAKNNWSLEDTQKTGFQNINELGKYLSAFSFQQSSAITGESPFPLLLPRWGISTYESPLDKAFIDCFLNSKKNSNQTDSAIASAGQCVFRPAVSSDTVFMRTAFGLTALDRQTGKRIWNSSGDITSDIEQRWEKCVGNNEKQALIQLIAPALELRYKYDYTYGSLQTDANCVYAIEDIWKDRLVKENPDNVNAIIAIRGIQGEQRLSTPNRLAAYDIKSGKLKWHIGSACASYGGQGTNEFDKVVFLGVPYAYMNRLYILGENHDKSISLYELDAQTGKKMWSQTMGESENIYLDRMYNFEPCFSNGILVCPTSRNSIVAIDLFHKRLLWGFVVPDADSRNQRYNPYQDALMFKNDLQRLNSTYSLPSRKKGYQLEIIGNNVVYTPVMAENSYILNLSSGEINHQFDGLIDKYDTVDIISANNNQAVILSKEGIVFADLTKLNQVKTECDLFEKNRQEQMEAEVAKLEKEYKDKGKTLDLEKDASALIAQFNEKMSADKSEMIKGHNMLLAQNTVTVKFPENAVQTGKHFISGDSVFIPLSNKTLVEFSISQRKFVNTGKTWDGKALGNLFLLGEQVFSQKANSLECFDLKELFDNYSSEQKSETKDLYTLLALGYIDWQNEKLDSALNYFKQAATISPRSCQPLLKAFLFYALKSDFETFKPQLDSLSQIISDPQSEFMIAQLQLEQLFKTKDYVNCFDCIKTIIEDSSESGDISMCSISGENLTLHRDIWIGDMLEQCWRCSSQEQQNMIAQWALSRIQKEDNAQPDWLLRQLDYFSFLPAGDVILKKLTDCYKDTGRIAQTELQLRAMRDKPNATREQIAGLWAQQAKLIQSIRPVHAGEIIRLIAKQYPDVPCFDNLTAQAYIESLPHDNPVYKAYNNNFTWNSGEILFKEVKPNTSNQSVNVSRYYNNRSKTFGSENIFLSGVTVKSPLNRTVQMIFVDKYGRIIMSISQDAVMQKGRVMIIRSEPQNESYPWWSAEHLFFFSGKNGEITASSLFSPRPFFLWKKDYLSENVLDKNNPYYLISCYAEEDENTIIVPEDCEIYGNILLFPVQENALAGIDILNGRLRWKRYYSQDMSLVFATQDSFYLTENNPEHIYYYSNNKKTVDKNQEQIAATGLTYAQRANRYSISNGMKIDSVLVPHNIVKKLSQGVLFKTPTVIVNEQQNDTKTVKQTWGLFDVANQKTLWKKEFTWDKGTSVILNSKIDSTGKLLLLTESLSGRVMVVDIVSGAIFLDDTFEVYTPEERKAIVDNVNQLKKKLEQEKIEQEKLEKEEEKDPQKRLERIRRQNKNVKTENLIPINYNEADAARCFDDALLFSEDNGDFYLIVRSSFGYVKVPTQAAFPIASLKAESLPKAKFYKFNSKGKNLWKEPIVFTDQFFYSDLPSGLPFILVGCNRRESGGRTFNELNFIDKNTGHMFIYKGKRAFSVMEFCANPEEQTVEISTEQGKRFIMQFTDKAIPENAPRDIPLTLIEAEAPKKTPASKIDKAPDTPQAK